MRSLLYGSLLLAAVSISVQSAPSAAGKQAKNTAAKSAPAASIPDLNGVYLVKGYRPNLIDMGSGLKEIPFLPEAAAKYKAINHAETDTGPSSKCLPPGIGFLMTMPYVYEIIQTPQKVLTFHEFGNYVRQIWMDGRGHEEAYPTWLGHSIGKYEGNTLVVDTVGFNGKGWMDQLGLQASDALHTVERFQRNGNTLDYSMTIEDPKTFTQPFTIKGTFEVVPKAQVPEFVCMENNLFLGSPGMHMDQYK